MESRSALQQATCQQFKWIETRGHAMTGKGNHLRKDDMTSYCSNNHCTLMTFQRHASWIQATWITQ